MQPIVTLINPPKYVLETIWVLWERSKTDAPTPLDVTWVANNIPRDKLEKLFWDVLRQHIPIAEQVHFTFMLDGVSVSLREQMVRHRIGTSVGPNYGVDIVPDLATSSWWSQSMRIQDMGTFAERKMYRIPDTLAGKEVPMYRDKHGALHPSLLPGEKSDIKVSARSVFMDAMDAIQEAYAGLVKAGVPMEDARELIPLGAQHSISWDINLQALLHVLGKRGCWILQLGIWGPIIHGMIKELADKVHPMFSRVIAPPCIDQDDNFKSCQYRLENARRITGEDAHPPCPLWLCRDENGQGVIDAKVGHAPLQLSDWYQNQLISTSNLVPRQREMQQRAAEYQQLWRHDPYTWRKLP